MQRRDKQGAGLEQLRRDEREEKSYILPLKRAMITVSSALQRQPRFKR